MIAHGQCPQGQVYECVPFGIPNFILKGPEVFVKRPVQMSESGRAKVYCMW